MSGAVHVTLPPFSRLCLVCNSANVLSEDAGRLDTIIRCPETRSALDQLLPGLRRHLSLMRGVCRRCRSLLLTWQRQLDRQRAAADAVSAAYRQGEAARRRLCVRLRRGAESERQVTLEACCGAEGAPTTAELCSLVSELVENTFGKDALAGTVVVDCEQAGQSGGVAADVDEMTDALNASVTSQNASAPSEKLSRTSASTENKSPYEAEDSGHGKAPVLARASSNFPEMSCVNDDIPLHETTSRQLRRTRERMLRSARACNSQLLSTDVKIEEVSDEEPASVEAGDGDWRPGQRSGGLPTTAPRCITQDLMAGSGVAKKTAVGRRGSKPNSCHMCRRSFRGEHSLRAHVEKLHKVPSTEPPDSPARVWCPACTSLVLASDVTGHVTTEHGGRLHCTCCGVDCDTAEAAAEHCVSAHTANYMCIVCLEMYSSHEQLVQHMNGSHSAESPGGDQASAFDPVSAVYDDLVRRLKAQARRQQLHLLGRTVVRCPYCAQTCSLHYLRTHLYKHKAAGFRCRICEKEFKFPVSYQKHLLLHAGRAEKCPHCDAVFTGRSNLRSHLLTHSSEKKFGCDSCAKRFKYKQTRDAHMAREHGGGAARVCHVCGASFRLQYQLTVHLARHKNGRRLPCPLCARMYELNLDLKRHLYSKHRLRVAEVEKRFPEIRRRPNTLLEITSDPGEVGEAADHAASGRKADSTGTESSSLAKISDKASPCEPTEAGSLVTYPTGASKARDPAAGEQNQSCSGRHGDEGYSAGKGNLASGSDALLSSAVHPSPGLSAKVPEQTRTQSLVQLPADAVNPAGQPLQRAVSPHSLPAEHHLRVEGMDCRQGVPASVHGQTLSLGCSEPSGSSVVSPSRQVPQAAVPVQYPAADPLHPSSESSHPADEHSSPVLLLVGGGDVGVLIQNVMPGSEGGFA